MNVNNVDKLYTLSMSGIYPSNFDVRQMAQKTQSFD